LLLASKNTSLLRTSGDSADTFHDTRHDLGECPNVLSTGGRDAANITIPEICDVEVNPGMSNPSQLIFISEGELMFFLLLTF
jgi:hypothetical protein